VSNNLTQLIVKSEPSRDQEKDVRDSRSGQQTVSNSE
jgi:hypothetical protein